MLLISAMELVLFFLNTTFYPDENSKKEIIRQNLKINGIVEILQLPVQEINKRFGITGNPSAQHIQYPGKWELANYHEKFRDKEDLLKICKFKWAFNIKPDIVIHIDKNTAICIEAKFESGEGHYPSSGREKTIFNDLKLEYIGQTELQKYMMEELLEIKTEFLFLAAKKEKSSTHKVINWADAFGCLDMTEMPGFAVEMMRNLS